MIEKKKKINKKKYLKILLIFFLVPILLGFLAGNLIKITYPYGFESYDTEDKIIQFNDLVWIAEQCNQKESGEQKVKCVNNWVFRYYDYKEHHKVGPQEPLKTLNEGGDCDDIVEVYDYIFKMMDGVNLEKISLAISTNESGYSGHQFGVAYFEMGYCILDTLTPPMCVKLYS